MGTVITTSEMDLVTPVQISGPPVITPRSSHAMRESLRNERRHLETRAAICEQLTFLEEAEINASSKRAEDEKVATDLLAREREQNRLLAECLATAERSKEEYCMKLSEFEALQERFRLAEAALQRAEHEKILAVETLETEEGQLLTFSKEARVAEVNLMNSKAEEDRAVKERAALEESTLFHGPHGRHGPSIVPSVHHWHHISTDSVDDRASADRASADDFTSGKSLSM